MTENSILCLLINEAKLLPFNFVPPPQMQRVLSKDGNLLSKTSSGMQSGGEEEQDEEAHTPLPPPMEIIKDPSAQDDKVGGQFGCGFLLMLLNDELKLILSQRRSHR